MGVDSNLPEEANSGETQNTPEQALERDTGSESEPSSPNWSTDAALSHEDLYKLVQSHRERFLRLEEQDDIDKAIECGIRALDMTPRGHPALSSRHASLGAAYGDRFWLLGDLNDLEASITHELCALELTPDGHPDLRGLHDDLGIALSDRFERLGELNDLEKSIEHRSRALALTLDGHPSLSRLHIGLGVAHTDRFERLGELDDLGKAIEYRSRALELTPSDDSDLLYRHAQLGASYGDRFGHMGKLDDLDKAIEHNTCALTLSSDEDPKLFLRHLNLGASYGDRFQRLGQLVDLEKAIEHKTRAIASAPDGHQDLSNLHAQLGQSYRARFRRLGELNDLEKSIEHKILALASTSEDHPDLSSRHAALGVAYGDRFQRLGKLNDLEKGIEHDSLALALTPEGHPGLSRRYASLGASYGDRFRRLGQLGDLIKAIEHDSRALSLTPDGHPDLAHRHAGLGMSYRHRFWHLGEMSDLEKSFKHRSLALASTPAGHPDLPDRHAKLGVAYTDRVQYFGELVDLEKAIEHKSLALTLTPEGHPDLSDRHANLGVAYNDRFQRLGEMDDLEKSINHGSRALELTPEGHPDLSRRHADLGSSFIDRFRRLGELKDLIKATEHESSALALTPDGHPSLPERHFNRAEIFLLRHQHTGDSNDLTLALHSFRVASQLPTGASRDKFEYALYWAKRASENSLLNCIEAYQATMDLLPQFIWLGATTTQRYHDLMTAENLAVNAAYAAILHSNYKLALEWLEHARCVVWNQTLTLRSPVDELQSSHPDLAARLQVVAKQLHDTTSSSQSFAIETFWSTPVDAEQVAQQRLRLAEEYNGLLAKIRELPGFEDFLQPMKANRLVCAARNGPVVVINCHEDRCDALLILPGKDNIKPLSLPNFTAKKAQKSHSELESCLRRKGLRQRGFKVRLPPGFKDNIASVLLVLWEDVVKPILDFLELKNDISVENLPHITWCPTGPMSFLPLHAAGDYDQPGSRAFDYVISSYTPTLTALIGSTSNSLTPASRVLAIGQAHTPGHTPLPGTARELACVRAHTQNKAEYLQLIDNQATAISVLDAMEQHDWVHLACHAHQNVDDPTKSGFFLYGGTLDLASINQRSFKNKGLAFLSACQTATGDEKLPDEAIHLASGMLMAGYPSVIATMWSVSDTDAPFVADKVYAELMKDGKVGNGEAGKALHNAVGALREQIGEKEFARWVPYIHIGS